MGDGTEGIFNAGWSIDTSLKQQPDEDFADMGAFDSMCTDDYVEIPSSFSGPCGMGARMGGTVNSRYCGSKFGAHLILEEDLNGVACHGHTGVCVICPLMKEGIKALLLPVKIRPLQIEVF